MFMNRYEIDDAYSRYRSHPVLGPATRTLVSFRDAVDANSDGWPYWVRATNAANRLMELITRDGTAGVYYDTARTDAGRAEAVKAYSVLKAFRTKSGLDFVIYDVPK